ncbi:alpha/beta hydrolase [Paracrocinitomix mangrovi]|uniref:alpha/beta fold hydrolase n=1 Tax=Paracrocinitomix mangrovi TaxID=2862509 RepID=UPI001C8E6DCE|nr:alpha/beta hydrolase [Paracrocinitomix mangrovi]UKN03489.1 alpha/beta hydrolase [Paracrocinitomix mangrovi]
MKNIILIVSTFVHLIGYCQIDTTKAVYKELYDLSLTEYEAIESEIGYHIQTDNVKMHYISLGDSTDMPLIWIPGTGSSSWEILNFKDSLMSMGLQIISIDYYGHGQTPMPKEEKSIYHIADDIKFLMDSLQIKKAIIGGWSRGGYIASAFYDTYPESVLGLMLVDGGSANALNPRYKMNRDTLREKYKEAQIPKDLLVTYNTKFEAFCALADTSNKVSQAWILDGLKIGLNGKWGYTSDVWQAVANESVESMLNAVESPTLAPLLSSSTYLMQPLIVYRNLSVPMIIIDPVSEGETWQNYTPDNSKLKAMHPELIEHRIYENTQHHAHFQRPQQFINDMKLLIEKINN